MLIRKIVLLITCCLAVPCVVFAELNTDLRIKLGSAAGVEQVEATNIGQADTNPRSSGNFQIDLAISQKQEVGAFFVGSLGLFGRSHSGHYGAVPPDIKYDAGGISGAAGAGVKAGENIHFEGKLEIGIGSGKPTLTTPGFTWNTVKEGIYSSASLIVGGYYTVAKPGLQIGLELGTQSFIGNFQIWNNAGYWVDSSVKGSGGIANLVFGYQF